MNYKRIEKIAEELEKYVMGGDSLPNKIKKRTEQEREVRSDLPSPSLEAGKFDEEENINVANEDEESKKASVRRLIHLAHKVKASNLSESGKRIALKKIADARKRLG